MYQTEQVTTKQVGWTSAANSKNSNILRGGSLVSKLLHISSEGTVVRIYYSSEEFLNESQHVVIFFTSSLVGKGHEALLMK